LIRFGRQYKKLQQNHSYKIVNSTIISSNILLIDNSDVDLEIIQNAFTSHSVLVEITLAKKTSQIISNLSEKTWQSIILTIENIPIELPQLIDSMPERNRDTPIIVIVNEYNRSVALNYLTQGVSDVIAKSELNYLATSYLKHTQIEQLKNTLHRQRQALQEAHDRFRSLTTQTPMAIAFLHEGAFINVNPEFQQFFAIKNASDIPDLSFLDLIAKKDQSKVKNIFSEFSNNIDLETKTLDAITVIDFNNNNHTVDFLFARTNINNEQGLQLIIKKKETPSSLVSTKKDDKQFLSSEYFLQLLNQAIQNIDTDIQYALVMIELDGYTKFKHRIGITRNESLFQDIHNFVREFIKPDIIMSKLGTEIITILINKSTSSECYSEIESLQNSINQKTFSVADQEINIETNIGFVYITNTIHNPDQALSLADVACTVSRSKKNHEIHVYNPIKDRSTVESIDSNWSERIKDAIKNDNFKLVFQPIIHLKTEPTPIYEALLRMKSSSGSDILPGQFLHNAKLSNLEQQIDKWVIGNASETAKKSNQPKLILFLNISDSSVKDIDFLEWLKNNYKQELPQMVFEFTEKLALDAQSDVIRFSREIHNMGGQICIDRFGNQPDAINELVEINADYIKIDGAFINHLSTNRKHQSIIHSVIKTTAKTSTKSIACFVQDADSLAILWREGVDYIQGNYLQSPIPELSYKFDPKM